MGVRNVGVTLTADDAPLVAGFNRGAQAVERFVRETSELSANARRSGQALDGLAREAQQVVTGLSRSSQATEQLTQQNAELTATLGRTVTALERTGRQADSTGRRTERSWRATGVAFTAAAAAGIGLAGGMAAVEGASRGLRAAVTETVVSAAELETSMRNVNSIAGETEAGLRAVTGQVVDLSTQLPQSANTLALGLYEISSSGFQGAQGLSVLQASAEAASAGLTTTEVSAKAISAVLNAYGRQAGDARDISDVLFQTVNLGVVSFQELAGSVGDVVGAAAAAKVPIEDVGAALAAMTLTGISGAESATSLNQLLTKLIQPSEALAKVYDELGYSSGAAALETRGLQGVMTDLQTATGGNITALLDLFPEIRAARGALALMSNEGRTYARVADEITSQTARAGATQAALAEQSKATAFQLTLLKNEAEATGIQFGQRLLPGVLAVATGLRDAAVWGGDRLVAAWQLAEPALQDLAAAGMNVLTVLQAVWRAAEPAAAGIAEIGGGAALGALSTLAAVLSAVTGFLAEHTDWVLLLGTVYASKLLVSLAAATVQMVAFNVAVARSLIGLGTFTAVAAGAAAAARGLAASLLSVQTVATAGLAAALFILVSGLGRISEAEREAGASIDKVQASFDALNPLKAEATMQQLLKTAEDSVAVGKQYEGFWGTMRLGWDSSPFGDGSLTRTAHEGKAAAEAHRELAEVFRTTEANVSRLGGEYGLTAQQVRNLAIAHDIDLSKPWTESAEEVAEFRVIVARVAADTGVSMQQLAENTGLVGEAAVEAALKAQEAIAELQAAADKAFAGATDVISSFKPNVGVEDVEQATKALDEARTALGDLRAEQSAGADNAKSVEDGIRRVADAEARLTEARATQASGTLEAFYADAISLGESFSKNLTTAVERGLDPAVVARLLEQGPAQAGPILEQLVGDHSGRLIGMVNESEQRLSEINRTVVEQARLTGLAVASATDEMSGQLALAMQISQASIASQGKATADEIAAAIGVPSEQVLTVARNFGITIATAVQQGINSVKPTVPVQIGATGGQPVYKQGERILRADGGLIPGHSPSPTADNIPVWATAREFMQPVAAVDYYGVGVMEAIRRRQIPAGTLKQVMRGYYTGGLIQAAPMASAASAVPAAAAGPTIVRVPVHETHTSEAPIHIGTLVAADVEDFERQSAARRQRHARMGWAPR